MENCPSTKPEDQRVRLTKQLLQGAFLQLLAQKPVQSVTVKELCAQAGVNRGTFYLHYKDVYDLMEQMEGAMLEDLDAILDRNTTVMAGSGEAAESLFASIFEFVEKNRALCAVLLGDNGDKKFVAAIIRQARDKSVNAYLAQFPAVSRQNAELFYHFIAWGFIGLLQHSLQAADATTFARLADGSRRIVTGAAREFFGMEK